MPTLDNVAANPLELDGVTYGPFPTNVSISLAATPLFNVNSRGPVPTLDNIATPPLYGVTYGPVQGAQGTRTRRTARTIAAEDDEEYVPPGDELGGEEEAREVIMIDDDEAQEVIVIDDDDVDMGEGTGDVDVEMGEDPGVVDSEMEELIAGFPRNNDDDDLGWDGAESEYDENEDEDEDEDEEFGRRLHRRRAS